MPSNGTKRTNETPPEPDDVEPEELEQDETEGTAEPEAEGPG